MNNPLRLDPTMTTMMRRAFSVEMRKKFRELLKALDLYPAFTEEEIAQFVTWLEGQIDILILAPDFRGEPFTSYWIRKAYLHGAGRAYSEVNREQLSDNAAFFLGGKNQFLRQLVGFQVSTRIVNVKSRLSVLLARVFEELKGVTGTLAQKMARTLSQGLTRGETRDQLLKRLRFEINDITKRRALTIARTEIIRANATGKLDAYRELGITEVEIEAEFVTAGDLLVCPICQGYAGRIFTLDEIEDLIPVHPQCRCEPRIVKRRPERGFTGRRKQTVT